MNHTIATITIAAASLFFGTLGYELGKQQGREQLRDAYIEAETLPAWESRPVQIPDPMVIRIDGNQTPFEL